MLGHEFAVSVPGKYATGGAASVPEASRPVAVYVPYRISGNQVFIAGQIPPNDLETPTYGKLGRDLTLDEGYIAAKHVGLRILSQLKAACNGDLDRVVKCLQIRGFVKAPYYTLGTDGYGRSDSRQKLREFFEVDATSIARIAIYSLFRKGDFNKKQII